MCKVREEAGVQRGGGRGGDPTPSPARASSEQTQPSAAITEPSAFRRELGLDVGAKTPQHRRGVTVPWNNGREKSRT